MITKEINDLRVAKDWAGSEAEIKRSLANDPTDPDYWFCLAEAVGSQNRYEESLGYATKAIALDPLKYQAWAFLANAHAGMGNWAGVESASQRSIELAPDLPQAHWLLGHCAMAKGNWGEAWQRLEYGVLIDRRKIRGIPSKSWAGQDVKGKTLFVWGEQGQGDVIQYARFLPALKEATGASIIFECRASLVGLLGGLADMTIAEQPDKTTTFAYDYHLPVMDIPRFLGYDGLDIDGKPYLKADKRPDGVGKIGIVWRGFEGHGNDFNRSMPTELLSEFKDIEGLVAIQPGIETPEWLPNLPVSDFASTASVLAGLKCLITVDTATAHVAGALGVPTIMMAPMNNTEPRWAVGDSTPWYDSWQVVHAKDFKESIMKVKELLNGVCLH